MVMRPLKRIRGGGTGHAQRLWPVLLLVTAAAVAPTASVLWFMGEAIRNEELAGRQRLADAYRGQLLSVQASLGDWLREKAQHLQVDVTQNAAVLFEQVVREGAFDSVVVLDGSGQITYPVAAVPDEPGSLTAGALHGAYQLEYEAGEPERAAGVYGRVAEESADATVAARALLGAARCLLRLGYRDEAVEILSRGLQESRFEAATDEQGRLIAPAALMLAIESSPDAVSDVRRRCVETLARHAGEYIDARMPSSQRLFIMEQLQTWQPGVWLPTIEAERLAQAYLARQPRAPMPLQLVPCGGAEMHQFASESGRIVGLLTAERLARETRPLLERAKAADGVVRLLAPGETANPQPLVSLDGGRHLPGWTLALSLPGQDPFAQTARRKMSRYLWAGLLASLLTIGLASVLARYVGRQVQLTRLKNDLIATVSHELKTPLASIRALVDTLLTNGVRPQQTQEYLQLIAKENLRLTRLIDNFLTFSRMERRKHAFEFAPVAPADVAERALEAVRERCEAANGHIEVQIAGRVGELRADRDALVVVLLNLLDNAIKYTGANKRITLSISREGSDVCFAVSDNGIGMSRRAARKVFNQFYQVDQTLSRKTGGCGLGLSIVKFIVEAHGGSVQVESRPGVGSTFTVRIPADEEAPVEAT